MLEEMKLEEIPYEKWEVTEGAKDLLNQIQYKVEKATKKNKTEIKLDYKIKFLENSRYRSLQDYEKGYMRQLLRDNGYQLPPEISMIDGFVRGKNQYGVPFIEPPYITWFSEEEVSKQKKTTFIFYTIVVIVGIILLYIQLSRSLNV